MNSMSAVVKDQSAFIGPKHYLLTSLSLVKFGIFLLAQHIFTSDDLIKYCCRPDCCLSAWTVESWHKKSTCSFECRMSGGFKIVICISSCLYHILS